MTNDWEQFREPIERVLHEDVWKVLQKPLGLVLFDELLLKASAVELRGKIVVFSSWLGIWGNRFVGDAEIER